MEGGGYSSAVMVYQGFMNEIMAFANRSLNVQKQVPVLSPDAILRDYPNERFALDCITEMFLQYSNQESKKYSKSMDEISQRANDAKELYLKEAEGYSKEYASCIESCGTEYCLNECHRKFCARECPNANKFNEILRQAYNDYRTTFSHHTSQQKKLLDDLYGFANPWLSKIYSPYWSKIYAYEVKRVALAIVGNCYGAYPYPFQFPAHNNCGTDCSVYANPAPLPQEEVSKKDPEANSCPENTKFKISLAICELGLDCESIEFGCTALASGSVKRNFKRKNTTIFIGVGMKGGLGVAEIGAKAGATVTVDDHNEIVDVGGKVDLTANVKVGASKVGATATGSITVMTGLSSKVGMSGGIFKPGN